MGFRINSLEKSIEEVNDIRYDNHDINNVFNKNY
jgi:hypothetical protein